ncbi:MULTISPECIES: SusC/RagA family TonB-linked outer membrane protein [unclassified Kaistella]|uniref:SusC/RagA family TonB-linked outer membrane protein n=1 Tax=unclassified Kaistella TaxID=2762626 RepID=UPI0027376B92|nr:MULTISPECIES: SusC/RagA family TonB-linked outer membrane protein [unclassified Kaistella]MDP2453092.1 SusC/RagA family TonB-linked outer membrane protein [Kaistella sp. SH11-4b]MDP2456149.1 SusC/RagA family TonB-linked outer membrane protein [Kaistella sp. SH40-3]MDP2458905.1 SusC/RagA family TonB-linked outer membrane protein [Kaistella sp. SH19-2b]
MKNSNLKFPCLIAALYFGINVSGQEARKDTAIKEQQIEEVVMIGYGTRKKVDNTTAISSINAEELTKTKVLNATQAIQGKAAGVTVIASDLPGSTPSVIIRGLGTALSGRNPLYVVDGLFADNINNINSNDILTYDVLKDASALAIYGNRAANGVIIITTKSGKGKGISVEYDGLTGVRMPLKKVKMAGSNLFSYYTNTALGTTKFSQDQPINTDWFEEITRTGTYNQHNLSLSGSSENAKYFLSLGNYDEKSILNGSDYNRSTVRTNNEFKVTKGIVLTQTLSVAFTNVSPKPLSAFTAAYKQSPIVPVYFPSGQYGVSYVGANGFASPTGSSFNNVGNPVAQLNFFNEKQKSMQLQGGLKLDLNLMKNLKFTSQFSGEYYNFKSYNYADLLSIWLAADPTRIAANYKPTDNVNTLSNTKTDYFNWSLTNYLTYAKKFGVHDVEATIGTEAAVRDGENSLTMKRKNMVLNSNYWDLAGTNYLDQLISLNSVNGNKNTTNSYFARAQYKLMNRYLLTATIRRDGSSQFADGQKWGTFPAFGAGWVVSEESFLKDVSFLNLLKLRGGWGKLGNQNIPTNYLPFASGDRYNYAFGGNAISNGTTLDKIYDPNLSWEITEESSAGLDFEMANRRLKGSVDLYNRVTKNIILAMVPVSTSGISQNGFAHLGEVTNKGFEVMLSWDDKINEDWSYNLSGNYSHNKNNLNKLSDENVSPIRGGGLGNGQYTKLLNDIAVGQPLGSFWLWEVSGIDANGKFTYVDTNGNGKMGADDLNDRKFFGSYMPTSTYGVNVGLKYKHIDLSLNGYGTFGSKVYNGKKAQRFSGENVEYSLATDFYSSTNTGSANPAPFNAVPIASNYYLESGDFFRINNIALGYTLLKPVDYLSSLRIYVSAVNPFITQKFSGFSPELNGNGDPYGLTGIELDAYPTLRSFVLGLNLKF